MVSAGKLILSLCIAFFCVSSVISDHRNILRICKIECQFSDTFSKNHSCKLKALSRIRTAVSVDLYLKRPLEDIIANVQIFKKNSMRYLPYLVNTTFNACDLIGGASISFVAKFMKDWITPHANFDHPCPYSGHLHVKQLEPFADNIPVFVSAGDYRLDLIFYEKSLKTWIGTVRGYGTITMKPFISQNLD